MLARGLPSKISSCFAPGQLTPMSFLGLVEDLVFSLTSRELTDVWSKGVHRDSLGGVYCILVQFMLLSVGNGQSLFICELAF